MRLATLRTAAAGAALFLAPAALAQTAQTLPFSQNWSSVTVATANDYSTLPGFIGYLGNDSGTGVPSTLPVLDPQLVVADVSATPVSLFITPATPSTAVSGGVYFFGSIANPVVAFQGSGTADAPSLQLRVVTTGRSGIRVRYNLRDIDDAADDAIQPVALQFRAGTTGTFTNVPAAYVPDASSGPSLATLVTPVDVTLPPAADNQAALDIRWITGNAVGSDELIGIDDIQVTAGTTAASETPNGALTLVVANPLRGTAQVRFSTETAQDVRLAVYDVLGRQVATLANGVVSGAQSASLDTAALAPGVYVLRLTAGADVLTQTVTVVR